MNTRYVLKFHIDEHMEPEVGIPFFGNWDEVRQKVTGVIQRACRGS